MLTWKGVTTPWESGTGQGIGVCWAHALGLWVAVGSTTSGGAGANVTTSPDGLTWTKRTVSGMPNNTTLRSVAWSPTLNLLVATGNDNPSGAPTTNSVWTSPDGVTWTGRGTPGCGNGTTVIWVDALSLFAMCNGNTAGTSPDGITWTTTSTIPAAVQFVNQLAWSPDLSLFAVGGGTAFGGNCIATSPDLITWTVRTTPFDGLYVYRVAWDHYRSKWVATGSNAASTRCVMTSPDGVTWTAVSTPMNGTLMYGGVVVTPALTLAAGHDNGSIAESSDDVTFVNQLVSISNQLGWSPDLDMAITVGAGGGISPHEVAVTVPVATTGAGSGVCTSATLAGSLVPNTMGGGPVTWYFEWGLTTGYGNVTAGGTASGVGSVSVSDVISGLTPGVTYHFLLHVVHGAFESLGFDSSFVEGACPQAPVLNAEFDL